VETACVIDKQVSKDKNSSSFNMQVGSYIK